MGRVNMAYFASRKDKIIECIAKTIESEARVPSPAELAKLVGISRQQITTALRRLALEGRITNYGKGKWYGLAGMRFARCGSPDVRPEGAQAAPSVPADSAVARPA